MDVAFPGVPEYVQLLQTAGGTGLSVLLALAAIAVTVLWARVPGHADRWVTLAAAVLLTLLALVGYVTAVLARWWVGRYFAATPWLAQLSLVVAVALPMWVLWLTGYRWLTRRTRWTLPIYAAITVVTVALVALANKVHLGGGVILVAPDGQVWLLALGLELGMWVALVVYEGTRRGLEAADALP